MKKVLIYSLLLVAGLVGSQVVPLLMGASYEGLGEAIRVLTMVFLAYIMIHVGLEFDIDKSNLRSYGWDYVVAATAATFPWILCTAYFVAVFAPQGEWGSWDAWKESLLTARFAAPTSAGVLFSMLAAAGLSATWLYRKARVLAIFDDLDTVLLMIPLKMMIVGFQWPLLGVIGFMLLMVYAAWKFMHRWNLPASWPLMLCYSFALVMVCELVYHGTKALDLTAPIHLEVLLPAFVLGCVMKRPGTNGEAAHGEHAAHEHAEEPMATSVITAAFMLLVGMSMPLIIGEGSTQMAWSELLGHVLCITILANLGKMFPLFCYRKEAHWRERLAVSIGMWPRGEVGAGVLVVSLSYGISGAMVTVAMLSLAVNLLLTGVFIYLVKLLITNVPTRAAAVEHRPAVAPQARKEALAEHAGSGFALSRRGRAPLLP